MRFLAAVLSAPNDFAFNRRQRHRSRLSPRTPTWRPSRAPRAISGFERFSMYEFEQALQDHCPEVTLPYWDWTMAPYRPQCPELGWIIPPALQARSEEHTSE